MKQLIIKRMRASVVVVALLAVTLLGGSAVSGPVYAQSTTKSEVCSAIGSNADCSGSKGGNLSSIIKLVVNIISVIAGALAVIMIIVSGMKYITAGGDSNKLGSAKSTLIYAIIGLFIVAISQFIVQFVLLQSQNL